MEQQEVVEKTSEEGGGTPDVVKSEVILLRHDLPIMQDGRIRTTATNGCISCQAATVIEIAIMAKERFSLIFHHSRLHVSHDVAQ